MYKPTADQLIAFIREAESEMREKNVAGEIEVHMIKAHADIIAEEITGYPLMDDVESFRISNSRVMVVY